MLDHLQQAKDSFIKRFGDGGRIHAIRSPGRVNLIGEHTDYNDGFVCPMAIEPHVLMICRARDDGFINVHSSAYAEQDVRFSVDQDIARAREGDWSNYVRGPAAMLRRKGVPMVGMDCYITNTLPTGSGLSSSAAMEVGTMLALLTLAGNDMGAQEIASLCQLAEQQYAGMPCGIMDQSIVAGGREGHAMLLDCRDLSRRFIPLDANELRVVVVNSNFKHQLVGSEYADRRRECETGVAHFQKINPGITHLRDVTLDQVLSAKSDLDDVVFRRCRHVVTENARCQQFAELMVQSHESLRDDYDVSTTHLDHLVDTAVRLKGVYGSRMTGAGFGGCTVSLVQPRYVESFAEQIRASYMQTFDITPDVITTTATSGAQLLE